jgi:hypothetical protein
MGSQVARFVHTRELHARVEKKRMYQERRKDSRASLPLRASLRATDCMPAIFVQNIPRSVVHITYARGESENVALRFARYNTQQRRS